MQYFCDDQRHLVCVPYSIENLHRMAEDLGIKRCWFHNGRFPHYDIPKRRISEIAARCIVVSPRKILEIALVGHHKPMEVTRSLFDLGALSFGEKVSIKALRRLGGEWRAERVGFGTFHYSGTAGGHHWELKSYACLAPRFDGDDESFVVRWQIYRDGEPFNFPTTCPLVTLAEALSIPAAGCLG